MPKQYHAQQDLPALNTAIRRYAQRNRLFDHTRIPSAGPLISKEPPLTSARSLITRGLRTIQAIKEKRITNI